jgi:hypothetical protein
MQMSRVHVPCISYPIPNTGCGKLTSFFEYEMPYEKGRTLYYYHFAGMLDFGE